MAVMRQQASPAHGEHGAGLDELELARARDRIGRIADVSSVVEGKGVACGNGRVGGNLVAVVEENAGAEMEAAVEGKPVVVGFDGAEAQLAGVGDSVLLKV